MKPGDLVLVHFPVVDQCRFLHYQCTSGQHINQTIARNQTPSDQPATTVNRPSTTPIKNEQPHSGCSFFFLRLLSLARRQQLRDISRHCWAQCGRRRRLRVINAPIVTGARIHRAQHCAQIQRHIRVGRLQQIGRASCRERVSYSV